MSELFLHKRKVKSLFHLLEEHENDITNTVAWALAQSACFLDAFLRKAIGLSGEEGNAVLYRIDSPTKSIS